MRNVLLFSIFLFFVACHCDDDPNPEVTNSYLPLAIGNYWEFASIGPLGEGLIEHREVADFVTLNGRQYYLLVSTPLSNWAQNPKDSAYYRIDENGFVFVYRKWTRIEENRYRLNGKDGEEWSYDYVDNSIADMMLRKISRRVGKLDIAECNDYSFDVKQWADEEYTYTLAPGIGFLREFSDAWGAGMELKTARINGELIEF